MVSKLLKKVNKNQFKPLKLQKVDLTKPKRRLMKSKKTSSTLSETKLLKSRKNLTPLDLKFNNSRMSLKLIYPTLMMKTCQLRKFLKLIKKLINTM
jgi:hypothetical protein